MLLNELAEAVSSGDSDRSKILTEKLLSEGVRSDDIVVRGLTRGLTMLGEMWNRGEAFLVDVLCAVDAFKTAMGVVQPLLKGEVSGRLGKVVIGTVAGDIHYIGKNIVATMLEAKGFEVLDLGEDVSASKFCDAAAVGKPDILAMSCLVSTSLPAMEQVLKELKARGLKGMVKVMVGGPPVTPEFAGKIGADLYATNAFQAAEVAMEAMGHR